MIIVCLYPSFARAQACTDCAGCVIPAHEETRDRIAEEFAKQEWWMEHFVFELYVLPALMFMAEQASTVAMDQVLIIGTFIDAKHQLEVQNLFQELSARAHKEYHPSPGLCTFGTTIRSLAATERLTEVTAYQLSQWAQDRHMGNANVSAAEGAQIDRRDRLAQLRRQHCDMGDNNTDIDALCQGGAGAATVNRDLDYAGVMERGLTLDIDMTDGDRTNDEEDVIALASNLYDHSVSVRIPESTFHVEENQKKALDVRALTAKRSVAEASYFTIAGLKSLGTSPLDVDATQPIDETAQYMYAIMRQFGIPPEDLEVMLGERPSYYAQMEILTKKIYQLPNFYTDLYDTPANVERKQVAMQAIGLMQDFDTLQSYLRTEMMMSVILELEIVKYQEDVQNRINRLRQEGGRT